MKALPIQQRTLMSKSVLQFFSGNSVYILDTDKLQALTPDVILTQSLCDVCSIDLVTVERVVKRMKMPSVVLDLNPKTLQEVLNDVIKIGEAIGCEEGASQVVTSLKERVKIAAGRNSTTDTRPGVGFIEWTDPIFVGGHWTPEIIELAGARHPLNKAGGKSKTISDEDFAKSDPDIIIVAPCGMSLEKTRELVEIIQKDEKRKAWFENLRAVKQNKVVLVDGNEMFNRPGPRLVDALEFCASLVEAFGTLKDTDAFEAGSLNPTRFPWAPL